MATTAPRHVIYVAGKLAGANNFEIKKNVWEAEQLAMEVVRLGAVPLIPHANTGFTFFGVGEEEFWYEATLELLRRCNAVILVPNWKESKGAVGEVEEARARGIPVFETVDQLRDWLNPVALKWQVALNARFSNNAVYGMNPQYPDAPYHVGARDRGEYTHFGAGKSWEEAVANIKKVKFQRADRSFVYEEG